MHEVDQRITLVMEYLTAVSGTGTEQLRPSVPMREYAQRRCVSAPNSLDQARAGAPPRRVLAARDSPREHLAGRRDARWPARNPAPNACTRAANSSSLDTVMLASWTHAVTAARAASDAGRVPGFVLAAMSRELVTAGTPPLLSLMAR
jgi:hypothetical protein